MKAKEALNAIKEEVETVSRKLHELTEEELAQVSGGISLDSKGKAPGTVPPVNETPVIETPGRLDHDPWEVSERPFY